MNWCWQQDPDLRPTASEILNVMKNVEFCCLVDGVCINDYGKILCVYHHNIHTTTDQKEKISLNKGNMKPSNSFVTSQYENNKNGAKYEIWISSSNNIQCSTVTVLNYCGKFTAVEVCDNKVYVHRYIHVCRHLYIKTHCSWSRGQEEAACMYTIWPT